MKYVISVTAIILSFCFMSMGLAAEKYRWYIIKGKDGVCKVIQAENKTPTTIAGPYKTRENAQAAKEEKCEAKKRRSKAGTSTKKNDSVASEIDKALNKARRELRKEMK